MCSRFGTEFNTINFKDIIFLLSKYSISQLESIHIHFPHRDLTSFSNRIKHLFSIVNKLKESSIQLKSLDIGGGFPSFMPPSVLKSLGIKKQTNLSDYATIISDYRIKYNLESIPIIFEPGTAIAANTIHLVGNIKSINNKSNKTYINTDISRTLLGGLKNSVNYPVIFITEDKLKTKNKNSSTAYVLSGFTCVEGDIIEIPDDSNIVPQVGDKLVFSCIGSYSTVFKSPFIRGDIALFEWDGCELSLSRRAQTALDVTSLYVK